MHETVDKILRHPIASVVVISCVTSGIAQIVSAVKGNGPAHVVNFNVSGDKPENDT